MVYCCALNCISICFVLGTSDWLFNIMLHDIMYGVCGGIEIKVHGFDEMN